MVVSGLQAVLGILATVTAGSVAVLVRERRFVFRLYWRPESGL
jgi:hypothetical protein